MREWGRANGGDVNEAVFGDVAVLEGVVGFDGARVRPEGRPHEEGLVTDDCECKGVSTRSVNNGMHTRLIVT